ncbi:MAG TPA: hypothetical protein PK691_06570 [Thermomicrobiales bacterium]|nr:hypothetical protein [Thermomicrobiales bacterium]
MVWLAWRQLRLELILNAVLVLTLAAVFIPTGVQMRNQFERDQLTLCLSDVTATCETSFDHFQDRFEGVIGLTDWFAILPLLIGILIAAPLVLELERRSYRLAWTQSISRRHWVAVKFAMIAGGALAAGILCALLLTWWRSPLDRISGRLDPGVFQIEGAALASYCLFAAALVIGIGVVLRRTVPTVVLAAVAFIVIRVIVETWVRPHYRPSLKSDSSTLPAAHDLDWIVDRTGAIVTYQPASRFWQFQGIEAAGFVVLSVVIMGSAGYWLIQRSE